MTEADNFRARLEQIPSDTHAFISLCDIAERENNFEYLAELYKYRAQVTQDDEENADCLFKAGEVFLDRLNDSNRALEVLLEAFELNPAHNGIGARLDAIYREGEDWEKVLGIVEKRLNNLSSENEEGTAVVRSDLHQQAGEIYQRVNNDQAKALSHYRKAFELDGTNLLAIYNAREIYYALGKFKSAAKLCELEARGESDNTRKIALYRELAHILSDKIEDAKQGCVALKRALKLEPKNKDIKLELAHMVSRVPLSDENKKDHNWASEYLLRSARMLQGGEALEIALKAFLTAPFNTDAKEFLLEKLEEEHAPTRQLEICKEIVDVLDSLEEQAPVIRKIATLSLDEMGDAEVALEWLKKLTPLGLVEDIDAIAQISKGLKVRASQPPMAFDGANQPDFAAPFDAPDAGLFGSAGEHGDDEVEMEHEPLAARLSDLRGITSDGSGFEEAFEEAFHGNDAGLAGAVADLAEGVEPIESIERLKADAEEARLAGNEDLAETIMLQVLTQVADDQKATTYLERRYRARGDWESLKDLHLRAAHIETLAPAVRTVRLKEAARIEEEELKNIDDAIATWRMVHEADPELREALDALSRLLSQAERWEDLLVVVQEEAQTAKSKGKRIDAYRRIAEIHLIRRNDSEAAAVAYNEVLELHPDDIKALEALDEIYLREQAHEKLVPLIKRRAEATRNRIEKRDLLLRAAIIMNERLEQFEDAYQLSIEILKLAPGDDKVLELMESIDEDAENWQRLVGVLSLRAKSASDASGRTGFLRKKAAISAEKLEDYESAVKSWQDVLILSPGDAAGLNALAKIYRDTGLWTELVEVLQKQLETLTDPAARADQHRTIAHVLESELGDEEGAVASWFSVLENGDDVEALGALAQHYEREENWSELADVLNRQAPHVEDPFERADVLFRRARILEENINDREGAVAGYKNILDDVFPVHMETLVRLREILAEDGVFDDAASLLERQIDQTEIAGELKGLLLLLGDWRREELDDNAGAMAAYERASHYDHADEDISGRLDEVYTSLFEWEKLLKLIWGRYQQEEDDSVQLEMLLRGGRICEDSVKDHAKAWSWYRQAFDSLLHLDETMPALEEAATRMESWKELVDLYGILTRSVKDEQAQAEYWLKISGVFQTNIGDATQALEAVLRAFGLKPEAEGMLDRVDELGVAAKAWDRLATVYGVLSQRSDNDARKIELFSRYANILLEKAEKPDEAFDVILKAFELAPNDEELLSRVEGVAAESLRWRDLVRVYSVCAKLEEDLSKKCALRLKAAAVLRDELADTDGALVAVMDVLKIDPFSEDIREKGWQEVRGLEERLSDSEKGIYWSKIIELYRIIMGEVGADREKRVALWHVAAKIQSKELSNFDAAFDALREAQQLDNKDDQTRAMLDEMARDHGKWEELAEHYSDMLDEAFEMEDAVLYHRLRARILREELDKPNESAEHYWQIIQLNSSDLSSYEALVQHYTHSEQWNDLVNILERKMGIAEDEDAKKEIVFEIAQVWEHKIKNRFEAKDWYEQVLTMWPGDEQAVAALARLKDADGGLEDDTDYDDDIQSLMSMPIATKKPAAPIELEPDALDDEGETGSGLIPLDGDLDFAIGEDSSMPNLDATTELQLGNLETEPPTGPYAIDDADSEDAAEPAPKPEEFFADSIGDETEDDGQFDAEEAAEEETAEDDEALDAFDSSAQDVSEVAIDEDDIVDELVAGEPADSTEETVVEASPYGTDSADETSFDSVADTVAPSSALDEIEDGDSDLSDASLIDADSIDEFDEGETEMVSSPNVLNDQFAGIEDDLAPETRQMASAELSEIAGASDQSELDADGELPLNEGAEELAPEALDDGISPLAALDDKTPTSIPAYSIPASAEIDGDEDDEEEIELEDLDELGVEMIEDED